MSKKGDASSRGLPADASGWLSKNKELVTLGGVFVAVLACVVALFVAIIDSSNERHHDEISRMQSELVEAKQSLTQLQELQQSILRGCLDVAESAGAGEAAERMYADYLRRELKRSEDQTGKGKR